jgi:hypothetical protein
MCAHRDAQVRCKNTSNGGKLYGYQCLDCKALVSNWIDHQSPLAKHGAPPWLEEPPVDRRQGKLFGGER